MRNKNQKKLERKRNEHKNNLTDIQFFMAKYSFEFKMKVVQDYLQGRGGSGYLSKKYGIGNNDNKQVFFATPKCNKVQRKSVTP